MRKLAEVSYQKIEKDEKYEEIVNKVFEECFKEENLYDYQIYVSIILTNEEEIQKINKEYRNIDKATDVLSFPMFEAQEIENAKEKKEVLGDIIVCIPVIKRQAIEYEHSEKREFAYMLVHGFYHLMGYDHIEEEDKKKMRAKEDVILNKLGLNG
ncbi:MAG: rRNA maturation RNase YbeY [Clostridia bacterium]|nr:rRNA maturation RNase YbeY [Clostridia bacterium]